MENVGPCHFSNSEEDGEEVELEILELDNYVQDEEMAMDVSSRNILHWNYRNFHELPKEVLLNGEHIQEIYLKRNCLSTLPKEINRLVNLTNLYVVGNTLESLPPEIKELRSLKVLDLSQNYLKELPVELSCLTRLEDLILTQNQIKTIPKELNKLGNLKYLEISGNQIQHLSEELFQGLDSLAEFFMDQNPLERLPRSICHLKKLRAISICSGQLRFLPGIPPYVFGQILKRRREGYGEPEGLIPEGYFFPDQIYFRFDSNTNLTYLPAWLIEFHRNFKNGFEFFHCGLENESKPKLKTPKGQIRILTQNHPAVLQFDDDLEKINRRDLKEPNTLFELCLRQSYRKILEDSSSADFPSENKNEFIQQLHLPPNISRLLRNGPTGECFQCGELLFTQIWLFLFKLERAPVQANELSVSAASFCSSNCTIQFTQEKFADETMSGKAVCKYILENEISWSFE